MDWDLDLKRGADFLSQNLHELTNDGVSIKTHEWSALQSYKGSETRETSYYGACYILGSKGHYIEGEASGEVKPGTLIFMTPDSPYQLVSDKGLDLIYIGFELLDTSHPYIQKLFNRIKMDQLYLLYDKSTSASILLWLSILKLAAQDNTIYLKNNIDSLAITLFWSVLKDPEKDILEKSSQQVRSSVSILIYKAKLFIVERLHKTLTIDEVANHLHISSRHLSRLFNQELGQPFTMFIRKERIRKAGILLSDSDIPIKDIAEQTGFSSVHYFMNVFTKEMDMPPGKFREKFRTIPQMRQFKSET